jgi:hypothetical protein
LEELKKFLSQLISNLEPRKEQCEDMEKCGCEE